MTGDTNTTEIGVQGAAGRMGRQLVAAILERDDCSLAFAIDMEGHACIGRDVGELAVQRVIGVPIEHAASPRPPAEVIIDFSSPRAGLELLDRLERDASDAALVLGTTGFTDDQLGRIRDAADARAIVMAANYSVGVTLLLSLLRQAAESLGPEYDVEIVEAHHRHKVDAPSGTALAMGEAIAAARGTSLDADGCFARHGAVGPRGVGEIGFSVVRAGDIVGEHTALFAGFGERLELTHRATDRMSFARGAVRAACWAATRSPGFYGMDDVLAPSSDATTRREAVT